MTTSVFQVNDMHCSACESRIRSALKNLPGVQGIKINPIRRELFIDHDADVIQTLDLFGRIENTGFTPVVGQSGSGIQNRAALKRLGVAGIAMMQVMMQALALYAGDFQGMEPAYVRLFEFTSLLFCVPVVLYSAQPFFRGATRSLRGIRRWQDWFVGLSMDVPVAIAIGIAFSASVVATLSGKGMVYYDSVVMFTFLLLLARFVDQRLSARLIASDYRSMLPERVLRISGSADELVALRDLAPGDLVRVRGGERVPADGIVQAGEAHLDESLLTGESDAVVRYGGDTALAGTINCDQAFTLRVVRKPEDSTLAGIETMATQAELDKPDFVRRTDRIAGVFIFGMLLLAVLTFVIWLNLDPSRALATTLAVLVVSCPCALALATPAVVTAALNFLRRRGVILTHGATLEKAAALGALAIDKTGTLTTGALRIDSVDLIGDLSSNAVLAIAAGLERDSRHPVASAFSHANPMRFAETQVRSTGVEGNADGHHYCIGTAEFCDIPDSAEAADRRVLWLTIDGRLLAKFRLVEELRNDTITTLKRIEKLGITTVLLSGDSENNCVPFAPYLHLEAALDPAGKLAALKKLRDTSGPVMMVGDGINDIPVLANADVAAVVMEAPNLVKSKADITLLTNHLRPILDVLQISRMARRVIKQNLFWAIAYNLTMIPLAAVGLIPPWAAALGMSLSSLLVTLNASRLGRGVA
ncbi:MAG: cadmium-translocating P-type ATPase [Gammaproteobacteria bacterium]|nr:cadmium-translocating P-type ATPase [Gammaproteobacteria bacterium]